MSWNGVGAMEARMPWCGYYDVRPAIWAIAHTTQFADPGWRYLDDACGETDTGLSYVTLKHPRKELYSMIIVTGIGRILLFWMFLLLVQQNFVYGKVMKKISLSDRHLSLSRTGV